MYKIRDKKSLNISRRPQTGITMKQQAKNETEECKAKNKMKQQRVSESTKNQSITK